MAKFFIQCACVFTVIFNCWVIVAVDDDLIKREKLFKDVNQLAHLIESVHPDPYLSGGGKIAFHRLLQKTLRTIPAEGLTAQDFYHHIRPLVASVGDAHTWIRDPGEFTPDGIPLYLGVVEESLYVKGVSDEFKHLLGCLLLDVQGVATKELLVRQGKAMGADNVYQKLRNLAGYGFFQRTYLDRLIPEIKGKGEVSVRFQKPGGAEFVYRFSLPVNLKSNLRTAGSKITLPSTEKTSFVYEFLGESKKTVLLVIDSMTDYREAFEMWHSFGGYGLKENAANAYKKHFGTEPVDEDVIKILSKLPSATDVFKSLVEEMKKAGSNTLIIDLRKNDGGNSYMSNILIYYLYGRKKIFEISKNHSEIIKFSEYYFEQKTNIPLDEINKDRLVKLTENGYNFDKDWVSQETRPKEALKRAKIKFRESVDRMPTFKKEYDSGLFEKYYTPKNVVILSSQDTFSSGYTMMYYLNMAGAKIVGTPSSQAGNCYGDTTSFKLTHSKINGILSSKKFVIFPDDTERGKVLPVDYPLTYDKLVSYDFDLNSELLYALELFGENITRP
ncbi:S41 family peptidase [candidate division CSSED10-310 bacterium]|uniref:S41 family peptidase n=1 Tax=candidate division CSSED10-310 bacterium TaxID=2855610 RepID=A0ABV6YU56_UNCC1